jgi:hypothetical protein
MDSSHSIKRRQKREVRKLEEIKSRKETIKKLILNSKLLPQEEKENLEYAIDYIIYIMDRYKLSEGLDF